MTATATPAATPGVRLGAKQIGFLAQSTGRINLTEGSVRSGKTYITFLRYLTALSTYRGPGSMVIVGKNRDTVYRNLFEPIERDPSMAWLRPYVQYRRGAASATILGISVNVIGANDAGAESKIRGMTVALVLGDEVTTWHVDFFKQLLARMSPPEAQAFLTTNPDSPAHWLKVDYIDRLADLHGWRVWHFTMDDNPGLTAEYVEALKAEYQGLWYLRFIEGLWVAAEGAIYPMFDRERHVRPWASLPPMWRLFAVGLDYGTTNATSALLLGLGIDRNLYLIDEWRHDSRKAQRVLTDQEISADLAKWIRSRDRLPDEGPDRPEYLAVDPSAASLKAQFARDGYQRWTTIANAEHEVLYGIRVMASLLGSGLLLVSDRCTGFLSEIDGYAWDPKATEKGEDKPLKVADHSLDAARYALATTEVLWRDEIGPRAPF